MPPVCLSTLPACSEQLEFLEDKLREYRFLDPADVENKVRCRGSARGWEGGARHVTAGGDRWLGSTPAAGRCAPSPSSCIHPTTEQAVLLGQLDSVRRELVEVCERWAPAVLFGKEVVREVYAFAQVGAGAAGGACSLQSWRTRGAGAGSARGLAACL